MKWENLKLYLEIHKLILQKKEKLNLLFSAIKVIFLLVINILMNINKEDWMNYKKNQKFQKIFLNSNIQMAINWSKIILYNNTIIEHFIIYVINYFNGLIKILKFVKNLKIEKFMNDFFMMMI